MKKLQIVKLSVFGILIFLVFFQVGQVGAESPKMKMTTEIPKEIIVPDKVETRIGALEFFDGFPTEATVDKAYDFLAFQRGVDVFLDEMRAASMAALRDGHRELGVHHSNQAVIFENLMDSKSLWLTANTETVYMSTFLDLNKDGPTVIESPPNVLGILDDMWMRYIGDIGNAGPDKGQGGKFLILPPGYEGEKPEGYFVFQSRTYGVWFLMRGFLDNGDPAPAVAAIKNKLRIYPLAKAKNPPAMEFINASGKVHNTIHANNYMFFEEVNKLIQEEHDKAISPEARGRLALLGIIKGQPFNPGERMRKTLDEAALVGAAIVRSLSFASRDDMSYLYPDGDRTWFSAFAIGNHEFLAEDGWLNLDARVQYMYNAIGITPAMAVAMPGIGSAYAAACRDGDGAYLDGAQTYKLTLPPNVPAKDFWSVVLYDPQTRSMIQNDIGRPLVGSVHGAKPNEDGSFDVYFGPELPEKAARENWVQTRPGDGWFVYLRLYGPEKSFFEKKWIPGDAQRIE